MAHMGFEGVELLGAIIFLFFFSLGKSWALCGEGPTGAKLAACSPPYLYATTPCRLLKQLSQAPKAPRIRFLTSPYALMVMVFCIHENHTMCFAPDPKPEAEASKTAELTPSALMSLS